MVIADDLSLGRAGMFRRGGKAARGWPSRGNPDLEKYENSTSEAVKYMKTKDEALRKRHKWGGFCVQLTPKSRLKRPKIAHFAQNEPKIPSRRGRFWASTKGLHE
jgi:hypothetical protein